MHQRGGGRFRVRQFFESAVLVLATRVLDLRVKRFLARKMLVDERLGDVRSLSQFASCRVRKSFPGKERQGRFHNGLPPFLCAQPLVQHAYKLVIAHLLSNGIRIGSRTDWKFAGDDATLDAWAT